jgi:hypothetical protein
MQKQIEIARNSLNEGLPVEIIHKITGLDIEAIQQCQTSKMSDLTLGVYSKCKKKEIFLFFTYSGYNPNYYRRFWYCEFIIALCDIM